MEQSVNRLIYIKLNALRQEQREVVNRLNRLESDLSETKLVAEALKQVDPGRKCYRSQGGVLVEKTVKEVVPALEENRGHLESMVSDAKKEITDKGKAIQNFMTENNLVIRKQ